MKPALLEHLACPECRSALGLSARELDGDEVMEGTLDCTGCATGYPVRRGVPRFVDQAAGGHRTAAAFGWEWKAFPEIAERYEQQFLDWISPAGPETFSGRVVLEGGCGKGRHTRLAAKYGARAVIGIDLSGAVDVAFGNTRHLPGAHIVQADLMKLPLKPGSVDYAFSVGVIHHMDSPESGFLSLARAVRPGGAISVWVYGAENNAWIARFVSPVRLAITSRMPPSFLYYLALAVSAPLWAALAAVYRPVARGRMAWLRRWLFYYPYLGYISRFPFREIHSIVHDHLAAPVAYYLRREEVEKWYRLVGAVSPVIEWHNENSWRGYGRLPGPDPERTAR